MEFRNGWSIPGTIERINFAKKYLLDEVMEVRALVDKLLKSVPSMKNEIKEIDIKIENNESNIDELKARRNNLKSVLIRITNAIGTLSYDNQKLICYKYFEGLTWAEIGIRLGLKGTSIGNKAAKNKLILGKIPFDKEGNLID